MKERLIDILERSPVIAAIKNDEGYEAACKSDCHVALMLTGSIIDLPDRVARLKDEGKTVIVHADMIAGLSAKEVAVDYIKDVAKADGMISTKNPLVREGKHIGLYAIQRTFAVDSIALSTLKKQLKAFEPDAVEILPGILPRVIAEVKKETSIPVIAGGLLADKRDIMDAFNAGADAVSTTLEELWRA